uniref:Putative gamma-glutamylcyclotransferase n=1 Tax=Tetraselmis sp. GSL018 TaxID=582737 RepID=A0A061QV32_9CHLO|mmetsp:Transcript_18427/g.44026  ORF Transcript_18427/g.44026 Transcript_18427/m.44026 type:complete len:160 (-) Transcript_18427:87-566(-)
MVDRVFVYGTLMAPEITRLLISRVPNQSPATLRGFRRLRVKGQDFPAVISVSGSKGTTDNTCEVQGLLLQGLTNKELAIFDEYEDDDYSRETLQVHLTEGSCETAFVYVWRDEGRHLLEETEWDYEEFRRNKLSGYSKMVESFVEEIREQWEPKHDNPS